MMRKLLHEIQNCPNCGVQVTPTIIGHSSSTQQVGHFTVYIIEVTCPICSGKWLSQVNA